MPEAKNNRSAIKYEIARQTVRDIVASAQVSQFCIGITGNPSQRRASYRRWCRYHGGELRGFVMLDWEHSPEEIIKFEEWLFTEAKKHKKYANRSHVKYYPSVNRRYESQFIYVAWWSPAFL